MFVILAKPEPPYWYLLLLVLFLGGIPSTQKASFAATCTNRGAVALTIFPNNGSSN